MLLQLPEDILTNIFKNLGLQDVRNLMLTCKVLCYLIINDNVLWRYKAVQTVSQPHERLILQSRVSRPTQDINSSRSLPRHSWYKSCRASYNWCKGFFKSKVILQHRISYMPWIKLHNSEVLLITVGTELHCYAVNGFPNCNNFLWKLEVPQIVRNDIRTNDITRFILNGDLLVCGNRDGSSAVYRVDNIRLQPLLIEHIQDCHYEGDVEVTAVEIVKNSQSCYVVTASNDSSSIQFWHSNKEKDCRDYKNKFNNYMETALDADIGVRCLAVNENANKLAIGPNGNSRPLLIDTTTGQLSITNDYTKNKKQAIRDIQWHNENTIVYVTHSGYLQLMDIRNNAVVYTTKDPFQSTLYCVKTDGHRALIAGSSEYSRCVLFDMCSPRHVQMYFTQKKSSPVYSLDFNTSTLVTAVDRGIAALNFDILPATTRQRDYSDIFQ